MTWKQIETGVWVLEDLSGVRIAQATLISPLNRWAVRIHRIHVNTSGEFLSAAPLEPDERGITLMWVDLEDAKAFAETEAGTRSAKKEELHTAEPAKRPTPLKWITKGEAPERTTTLTLGAFVLISLRESSVLTAGRSYTLWLTTFVAYPNFAHVFQGSLEEAQAQYDEAVFKLIGDYLK